jgi:malate dehydrogenase (oxaloacetate-decarboxylating)
MKTFEFKIDPLTNEEYVEVYLRGQQLLYDPLLNKGAAFSYEERKIFGLSGFMRVKNVNIEDQANRSYEMLKRKQDDLEKYIFLQGLLNRNETLFYHLLSKHLKELLPIVYTPTVGLACQMMSTIMRRFRGIYITPENIEDIDSIFASLSQPEIYLVVVTDGERILGLGDLGSDGMGIPIGKVNLYVAAGGLNPACCLPVTLDVGTNNEALLNAPTYLGLKRKRLEGTEYDEFIEKFVLGIKRNCPSALLQWEDFAKQKAFTLLERYQERILSFNDDIQGTGATALSALISAFKLKKTRFQDERFVIVGMGQAGAGICYNIRNMLKEEGLTDEEIRKRIFAIDIDGLVTYEMLNLEYQMQLFAQRTEDLADWVLDEPGKISLKDVIRNTKATVLAGVTAQTKMFNDEILQMMAKNTDRPVILALSNPTSKSECTPEDVYKNTNGKGLIATGSPFDPIEGEYGTMYSSQCNNMYIFPGVGLGALVSKAHKINFKMFFAASKALSDLVSEDELQKGKLLPDMDNIREISAKIAIAVAKSARDNGYGRLASDDDLEKFVYKAQWKPFYSSYRQPRAQH